MDYSMEYELMPDGSLTVPPEYGTKAARMLDAHAELLEALKDLCDLLEDIRAVAPVAKQHAAARAAIQKAGG